MGRHLENLTGGLLQNSKALSIVISILITVKKLLCNAGKIPLRQLVYRVLDLPPSMRPLVYDFGQLTTWTEEDYTKQIVLDHVSILICIDIIMSCMIMSFLGSRYHRVISRLSISPCHFSALNITMSFLGS